MKKHGTYHKIVKSAEYLTQTRGYNGFSYGDIAELLGIKTSSIHYYFRSKADLGKAVVKQHGDMLSDALDKLINNEKLSSPKKLGIFLDTVFSITYRDEEKMCLGGILAVDILTLPEGMREDVQIFFTRLQGWIKCLLKQACDSKKFKITQKDINYEIKLIFSQIEGSILLARLFRDEEYLSVAKKCILARLIKK
jgi:TetR/AcrR family transcriptional regulator, transcriptional repressor for nem operon